MRLRPGAAELAQGVEREHLRVAEVAQALGVEDDDLLQPRQALAHREHLVELLVVLDEDHLGARVRAQVLDLGGGVGRVDAVRDAARRQHGEIGEHPFDDRVGEDRGGVAGREAQGEQAVADLAHRGRGARPGPFAPEAELLLPHEDAIGALRRRVPEDGRDRLARHDDAGPGLQLVDVPEVHRHRQVFFFFQRRSPRAPASFMPR